MKRWVKIGIGVVVGVPLAAVAGFVTFFYGIKPTKRAPQALTAPSTPSEIERGRYLANNVYQCVFCHSPFDRNTPGLPTPAGQELAGRDWREDMHVEEFKDTFLVYASNISPDKTAGIGAWTDGEIVRAMREGIRKDGSPIFDFMPYKTFRTTMSDADALAIVAYLKSAKPQPTPIPRTQLPLPAELFGRRMSPLPVDTPYPGPPSSPKERGDWLLSVAQCHLCHDHQGDDAVVPLGGGEEIHLPSGTIRPPNISSDPAAGIGAYTEDELVRVLTEGVGKSGKPLRAMPWSHYAGLSHEDKMAIAVALKASTPVH